MPAVLREGPYRFFFYAGDRDEPKHIHVARDNRVAKFWLEPVRLAMSGGLRQSDLRRIQRTVEEKRGAFVEAWDDYFND